MKTKRTNVHVFLVISFLIGATRLLGDPIDQVGSYNNWPEIWTALPGLNDGKDETNFSAIDFVGNEANPGAYWADNGTYVFFRVRVDVNSIGIDPFDDAHHILINVDNAKYNTETGQLDFDVDDDAPDYSFAWDSKAVQEDGHGLEMTHISTRGPNWKDISMDDIDGLVGQKGTNDINGETSENSGVYRTDDGYIRTVGGEANLFGTDTTFIDFAVSWNYLETYTDLERDQDWRVAIAAVNNATDHNKLTGDIGGGAGPDDLISDGWVAVPEPATMSLIGIFGFMLLIGRRVIGK
jgi:hypothetical protein